MTSRFENFSGITVSNDTMAFIKTLDRDARPSESETIIVAATLFQIGQNMYGSGCFINAMDAYSRSLAYTERALGTRNHENVAKIMYHMAALCHARGELQRALDMYRDVWSISSSVLGREEVAESLFQMGRVQRDLGWYNLAANTFQEALRVRIALHGEEHKDVAIILCNIAMVHRDRGELDKGLIILRRVLQIGMSLWGTIHKLTADVLQMIAEIYMDLGDYDDASEMFYDAHTISALYRQKCDGRESTGEDSSSDEIESQTAEQFMMSSILCAMVSAPGFSAPAA